MDKTLQPKYGDLHKIEKENAGKLLLNETFASVQGEGIHIGLRTFFVRFAGCLYRCSWCDTDFSYKFALSPQEVAQMIIDSQCSYVEVTGGEPFTGPTRIQQIVTLIDCTKNLTIKDIFFTAETAGMYALDQEQMDRFDLITISPKMSSSGEEYHLDVCAQYVKNSMSNIQFKFVIDSKADLEESFEFLKLLEEKINGVHIEVFQWAPIIFQPCWNNESNEPILESFGKAQMIYEYLDKNNLWIKYPRLRVLPQWNKYLCKK